MKNIFNRLLKITFYKIRDTSFIEAGGSAIFLILFCIISLNVHSQITLDYTNFLVPPLATYSLQGAVISGDSVPSAGANRTWDYGNLVNSSFHTTRDYIPETNPEFPNARRQIVAGDYRFFAGFTDTVYEHQSNNNSGLKFIGATTNRTAYSLAFKTGVSTDSLILLSQNIFYGGSKIAFPYPFTYQSRWLLGEYIVFNMQISLASQQLDHAPLTFVSSTLNHRTIVGWGKMKVPSNPHYVQCLMMKILRNETDSFYVNGIPADSAVLQVLDVTQGQRISTYQYSFKRKGIEHELMVFTLDSAYNTIKKIVYDDKYSNIGCGSDSVKMCLNEQNVCKAYKNNQANHAMLNQGATIGNCTASLISYVTQPKRQHYFQKNKAE